jgi:hypothetical protein
MESISTGGRHEPPTTRNGGLAVNLTGRQWDGPGLDLETMTAGSA